MPGARTLDALTLFTAGGANLAYFQFAPAPQPTHAVLFTASYLFAGYACAGDLDLDSSEFRRWGPLRVLWLPYQKIVPHRSWVSHGLILGGVIRALYLALVVTIICWLSIYVYSLFHPTIDPTTVIRSRWFALMDIVKARPYETIAIFSGFVLAGTTHSLADYTSTWFKRRF